MTLESFTLQATCILILGVAAFWLIALVIVLADNLNAWSQNRAARLCDEAVMDHEVERVLTRPWRHPFVLYLTGNRQSILQNSAYLSRAFRDRVQRIEA